MVQHSFEKVKFYFVLVLEMTIFLGIILSLILGKKYDFLFMIPSITGFTCICGYGFFKQFKDKDYFNFDLTSMKLKYRIFLLVLNFILLSFSLCGFSLLMIYGGNPEIIDGTYQIISHGEFVKEITQNEYFMLNIFSRYCWVSFILMFFNICLFRCKQKVFD